MSKSRLTKPQSLLSFKHLGQISKIQPSQTNKANVNFLFKDSFLKCLHTFLKFQPYYLKFIIPILFKQKFPMLKILWNNFTCFEHKANRVNRTPKATVFEQIFELMAQFHIHICRLGCMSVIHIRWRTFKPNLTQ